MKVKIVGFVPQLVRSVKVSREVIIDQDILEFVVRRCHDDK